MGWTSSEIEDHDQDVDEARKELERHSELPRVVKVIYGVGLTVVMVLVALGFLIVVLNLWQCGRTP